MKTDIKDYVKKYYSLQLNEGVFDGLDDDDDDYLDDDITDDAIMGFSYKIGQLLDDCEAAELDTTSNSKGADEIYNKIYRCIKDEKGSTFYTDVWFDHVGLPADDPEPDMEDESQAGKKYNTERQERSARYVGMIIDAFKMNDDSNIDLNFFMIPQSIYSLANFFIYVKNNDGTHLNIDVSEWDTSHITKMNNLFMSCSDTTFNVSGWDTSNVKTMYRIFRSAEKCKFIGVGGWNVSNVLTFRQAFSKTKDLEIDGIGKWDVSHCMDFQEMFYECTCFNQNLSNWKFGGDAGKTINFACMFQESNVNDSVLPWGRYFTNPSSDYKWCGMFEGMLDAVPEETTVDKLMGDGLNTDEESFARKIYKQWIVDSCKDWSDKDVLKKTCDGFERGKTAKYQLIKHKWITGAEQSIDEYRMTVLSILFNKRANNKKFVSSVIQHIAAPYVEDDEQ